MDFTNNRFPGGGVDQLDRRVNDALMGIGNVYHVLQSNVSYYDKWVAENYRTLYDGSANIHTSIQDAVNAMVAERNDYCLVHTDNDDYDITSVITLSKKGIHVICPQGSGYDIGANNSVRIHQNTAATAIFAISNSAIEIAGFYLKPYIGCSHITIANGSYALNIHHNTLVLQWTASNDPAISASGDGGAWGKIERNWIISQGGDAQTCAAVIVIGSAATGAQVNRNEITIGDDNIATVGIQNSAVKGHTDFNIFSEAGGNDVASGGTITKCVAVHATGSATGNRCSVAAAQFASGGTAAHSFVDNMDGATGAGNGAASNLEA
jgi:hypothetical protein